ncbi:MAG TPA: shikimate kinase [Dissulfurispiraceae bacterium]|nr:shikimate kinase [Dissulfurispiraceae bacterium]
MTGRIMKTRQNIVLTGFMGTGKTEVGRIIARKLGFALVDVDEEIEKEQKMKIAEIFRRYGEPAFRDMESAVIGRLSERERSVIATGGGAVLRQENMDKLRENGIIFCLKASAGLIYERTKGSTDRPLLRVEDPLAKISELLAARQAFYDKADRVIDTEGKSPVQVAEEIIWNSKGRK